MLLLTFTAGANRYAIDVARVVELVPRVELRAIPHAPAFLAGLLGYRGKVVPVIDLGCCWARPPAAIGSAPGSSWSSRRPAIRIRGDEPRGVRGPDAKPRPPRPDRRAGQRPDRRRPEQVVPAPVHLPQAPYLDAIVQTDQGIRAVDRGRRSFGRSLVARSWALEASRSRRSGLISKPTTSREARHANDR